MEVSPRIQQLAITGPSILKNIITDPSIFENNGSISASNGQKWGRPKKECVPVCLKRIATWNVEGMSGPSSVKFTELCIYMRQHGICLLCLQETHLYDAEHFEYEGFKIFLFGEALREGRSFSGVGFIVAPWALQAVVSFHAINDRLAKIRFKVFGGILNVLTVYVPHDGHDFDYR